MKESIRLFEGVTRLQGVCRERHSADGEKCRGCIFQCYPETDSCYLATGDGSAKPRDWHVPLPEKEDMLEALAEKCECQRHIPLSLDGVKKLSGLLNTLDKMKEDRVIDEMWLDLDEVTGNIYLEVEYRDLENHGTASVNDPGILVEVCKEVGIINI